MFEQKHKTNTGNLSGKEVEDEPVLDIQPGKSCQEVPQAAERKAVSKYIRVLLSPTNYELT